MSPDDIHDFLRREYPQLIAERRINPRGWSFYWGVVQRGVHSSRIIRAVQFNPKGVTWVKLAVSSRQGLSARGFSFSGGEAELRDYVDAELKLFHELRSQGLRPEKVRWLQSPA